MGRVTASQGLPQDGHDYAGLRTKVYHQGSMAFRAHAADRAPWWFDNGDGGRFNLHGDKGACYVATSAATAVRERLRDELIGGGVVSRRLAEAFDVSIVRAPRQYRCASVSSPSAVEHGMVRELVTMEDYTVTQAWSQSLFDAGFDGIFYASAYTTGGPTAYALFGEAGAPKETGYIWSLHRHGPDACSAIGVEVEGPPHSISLDLID